MGYRKSKHCSSEVSPAVAMINRDIKTRLDIARPIIPTLAVENCDIKRSLVKHQTKQVEQHRGNREASFGVGEPVLVRDYSDPNKASWSKATVLQKTGERNYLVKLTTSGRTIKRHTNQIVKVKASTSEDTEQISRRVENKGEEISETRQGGQQNRAPACDNVSFKTVLSDCSNRCNNSVSEIVRAEEEEEEVLGFGEGNWLVKPETRRNRKRKQIFDLGLNLLKFRLNHFSKCHC